MEDLILLFILNLLYQLLLFLKVLESKLSLSLVFWNFTMILGGLVIFHSSSWIVDGLFGNVSYIISLLVLNFITSHILKEILYLRYNPLTFRAFLFFLLYSFTAPPLGAVLSVRDGSPFLPSWYLSHRKCYKGFFKKGNSGGLKVLILKDGYLSSAWCLWWPRGVGGRLKRERIYVYWCTWT